MRRSLLAALALSLLASAPAVARERLVLERAVVLMRHGVRPPTKTPPLPAEFAVPGPWPVWSAKPGWLTEHGAAAIRLLGQADRTAFADLLPRTGCPDVALVSDSDQRTIVTGDAYAAGFAPGCTIANQHRPQDVPDPLFSPVAEGATRIDPAAAARDVAAAIGPGGLPAVERRLAPVRARLRAIFCDAACPLADTPSTLVPAASDKRPKLTGVLDRGSTAAQILLLEYTEGMPLAQVGWGRATAADIALLGQLHATEFAFLARPRAVAARNIGPVAERMVDGLGRADAARLSLIVGHDTDIASLGGLLGLHWQAPGFAADDPVPGGALVFELLRDRAGQRFVRARYRSQSLEQMRALAPGAAYRATLAIDGCPARPDRLCPLPTFTRLVRERLR